MSNKARCIIFRNEDLLPSEWQQSSGSPVYAFNPTLLADPSRRDEWILAYRVVLPDQMRRIAFCRLNKDLRIVPGSQQSWSDGISTCDSSGRPLRPWFADPRLYLLQGRIFLYWNSGWHEPENQQYLQEIDPNDFRPIGLPREMRLRGERRKLEKNWMLFECGHCFAVYTPQPHKILGFSLDGSGAIEFQELSIRAWDNTTFSAEWGELRGGAPPLHFGQSFLSICHALKEREDGLEYSAAYYRFQSSPPFLPLSEDVRHLSLGNPFLAFPTLPRLNTAVNKVIYPCGAAVNETKVLISYGINDEHCAISVLDLSVFQDTHSCKEANDNFLQ